MFAVDSVNNFILKLKSCRLVVGVKISVVSSHADTWMVHLRAAPVLHQGSLQWRTGSPKTEGYQRLNFQSTRDT